MKIRRRVQKDQTGCGIACVAMLSGITYLKARKLATELGEVPDEKGRYYTQSWQLRHILSELGVSSRKGRKVSKWRSINCLSIVGINYRSPEGKDATWHWVIYVPGSDGGYVLDPMGHIKSTRRRDFSRMAPNRYIPMQQPRAVRVSQRHDPAQCSQGIRRPRSRRT